jgi:7TM diverse intracellular signalling
MRSLILLVLVLKLSVAYAQEKPLVLPGKMPTPKMDIGPYTTFYEDRSGDTLPLSEIRWHRFRPYAEKRDERNTFSDRSMMVTWLRFTIRNSHPTDTLRLYHTVWAHMDIITYQEDEVIERGGIRSSIGIGNQGLRRGQFRFKVLLIIPPLRQQTYYVRVIDYVLSATAILSTIYSPGESLANNYEGLATDYPLVVIISLLLGCLLFMSVYALYSFLLTRDRAFLYYVLYTFSSCLIVFHGMDMRFALGWLTPYYPILNLYFPGPIHPGLLTIFYGLFIINVLGIQVGTGRSYWFLKAMLAVSAVQEGMAIAESFIGQPLIADNTIYYYGAIPSALTTLTLIGIVLRSNSPIRAYLLVGMICLLSLTLTSVLFYPNPVNLPPFIRRFAVFVPFWIALGLSLEAFCFMLALAYRGRLTELENRRIQERYAQDLEAQLVERSQEIEQQGTSSKPSIFASSKQNLSRDWPTLK